MKFRNDAQGPRVIRMNGVPDVLIMPKEEKLVDGSKIRGLPDGLTEVIGRIPTSEQRQALAHDDDEDVPPAPPELADKATKTNADLPSLDVMTKAQLEAQAAIEGVDIESIKGTGAGGNVLVGDLRAAIEAKRGAQ